MRACGTCSLCCKLPYVGVLNKPIDTWCPHARPGHGGCSIYADRPSICRTFVCGWLASTDFGDEWFPARSKMVIAKVNEGPLGQLTRRSRMLGGENRTTHKSWSEHERREHKAGYCKSELVGGSSVSATTERSGKLPGPKPGSRGGRSPVQPSSRRRERHERTTKGNGPARYGTRSSTG
jgi:hypothetical protein